MLRAFRSCLILVLFMALASGLSLAQSRETGVIQGQVLDEERTPLPGVSLSASSPNLMGIRSTVTDQEGKFRFSALPTGTYAVETSLQGFTTAKRINIEVHAGATATVDFTLSAAKLAEEIIVTGQTPMVDVTQSSLAKTYITKDLLNNLPTAQSTYGLINLAPGVADWSAFGSGNYTGNSYQVDGVELVDSWFGGGIYTAPIDYNVIEESQIVSLGAPAEYGNFTGALVNVITKSGGNIFSGDVQLLYRAQKWQSENIKKDDPKWSLIPEAPVSNLIDASGHLGGPILKDRLWFFGGYEYYKSTTEMKSSNKNSPTTYPKVFAKLTFQPTERNRLQAFFEYHNLKSLKYFLNPSVHEEANLDLLYPVYVVNLSFLHTFSPTTLFEMKLAGYKMKWDAIPSSRDRSKAGHLDLITGEYTQNWFYWATFKSNRYGGAASFSHNADKFLGGSHDFKMGVEFEKAEGGGSATYNGPDGVVFLDFNHAPYLAFKTTSKQWAVNYRTSLFAQDDWKIGDSLVINPGIRFNIYRGQVPDLEQADKTVYKPTGIEPRLGFAWDILKNHKTVLKAHYGRYYEGTKTYYIDKMTPASDVTYYFVGPNWASLTKLFTIPGQDLYSIDPDIKHPSMDSVVAGVEQVLGKDLSASVSLIYRKWSNFIESVDTTALFEKIPFTDPETGKVYTVYNQLNPGADKYYITNPKAGADIGAAYPEMVNVTPERTYKGIEFAINKRFSDNWQFYASYTYSKEEGTYSNSHTSHQSMNMGSASIYWDPTNQINLKGRSTISPPHVLKIQGTYIFPLGISLSAYYSLISGQTWTRYLFISGVNQASKPYLLTEPIGSRRLPATNNLDLRLSKFFLYKNFKAEFMLDLFNAFNQTRETRVNDVVGSRFSKPLGVAAPRTFRAGFRFLF